MTAMGQRGAERRSNLDPTERMNVRRLLYVEDNEDNLYMLTLFFDVQGGYEILSAATGAEGIARPTPNSPT